MSLKALLLQSLLSVSAADGDSHFLGNIVDGTDCQQYKRDQEKTYQFLVSKREAPDVVEEDLCFQCKCHMVRIYYEHCRWNTVSCPAPTETTSASTTTTTPSDTKLIPGGYAPFVVENNGALWKEAQSLICPDKEFAVTKSESQVVAGTNYRLSTTCGEQQCTVVLFRGLPHTCGEQQQCALEVTGNSCKDADARHLMSGKP